MGRPEAALIVATLVALTAPALADDLRASVPEEVVGDGRTSVPVIVQGLPPGGGKALPVTEVPVVTCGTAPGLAAFGNVLPAVLVPAVTAAQTIDCTARLRESTTTFKLKVRPPPSGLYASTSQIARTTDGEAKLSTFVWDGKRRNVPSWLHAKASDGTVTIGKGGILTLDLTGKAPRTIAIAMIDGTRIGAAFVPVTGSTVLPVEAEPNSSVQVWVAGTWYGPVPTKGKLAEVPIDVPAGVTHGVARSTDKKGYVSDVVIDLKIPARPRIAVASAAPSIGAGESTMLAVAIAGPDARPLSGKAKLVAKAERGAVRTPTSLGGGLWTLSYTAPADQGDDRISVQVEGDDRAGTGEVTLNVRGIAAKVELTVPPAFEPGGELTGTVRVLDAGGIVLREPELSATLAGEPIEVVAGEPLTLNGKVPEKAPANGTLSLEVVSGSARTKLDLFIGGAPASATIRARAVDRAVRAEVRVLDRFGNLVPASTFDVSVSGGKLDGMQREANTYVASITATDGSTETHIVVRSKGKSLAERRVTIDADGVIGFGAWLSGGYLDNLGAWASPRAAIGGAVKRRFGGIEAALLVGVEGMSASETFSVDLNGVMEDATRSIAGLAIPVGLRARLRLGERLGVSGMVALMPWRMSVKFAPDSQMADAYTETVVGFRGQIAGDAVIGPGRLLLGVTYGRATLSDGVVVGQVDGLGVTLGYEWWFGAIAP